MSPPGHSHLMKTTKRGRPFIKDSIDLFCTLIISMPMNTHRSFFKSYPSSFTTDEACSNLASLKISQSNRAADPKDPTRIITTTTTTTFSMSRDMAKGICQHFMDGRMMENATDLGNTAFKDRGVYIVTPKGLHVLERFITKNGIAADHVVKLFADQPVCMKLLHIERRSADDDIIFTPATTNVIWRRIVGTSPNVTALSDDDITAQIHSRWYAKSAIAPGTEFDRAVGLLLRKTPIPNSERKGSGPLDDYTFHAWSAIDWLCEFTTAAGPDEAGDVLAQLVRYGFITLHSDKGKPKDTDMLFTARAGGAGGGAGAAMAEADFRATSKAIYKITKEGLIAAKWDIPGLSPRTNPSKANLHSDSASTITKSPAPRTSHSTDDASVTSTPIAISRAGAQEKLRSDSPGPEHAKDSHTARLKQILDEPALRSLFREFLRDNFCEENLAFWLDTQDFKRKFNTTSSTALPVAAGKKGTMSHQAMEKHQSELNAMAFVIYNTYLAPASPCELNIDHALRAELINHINQMNAYKENNKNQDIAAANTAQASQLQILVKMYERIQNYIFRLMATDSVPKFCKTERFLNVMRNVFDYNEKHWDEASDQRLVNKGEGSPTRAYITISQAANEKAAAAERLKELEAKVAAAGRR